MQSPDGAPVITRTLPVPPDLVFAALTEAEHLMQWWQPGGHKLASCSGDAKPGRLLLFAIQSAHTEIKGSIEFSQVIAAKKLVFIVYGDEQLPVLNTIRLSAKDDSTVMSMEAVMLNGSSLQAEAVPVFAGCLDGLEEYLSSFFLLTIKFFNNGRQYVSYCRQGAGHIPFD